MARIARFFVPGLPHHVSQRGARRERVFFGEDDDALYRDLLASQCRKHGVAVFCLSPDAQPPFISFSSPTARRRSGARSARGAGVIRRQSTRGSG